MRYVFALFQTITYYLLLVFFQFLIAKEESKIRHPFL